EPIKNVIYILLDPTENQHYLLTTIWMTMIQNGQPVAPFEELVSDLYIPKLPAKNFDGSFWLNAKGHYSNLHYDRIDNMAYNVQIIGKRLFHSYPPSYLDRLHFPPNSNKTELDVKHVDASKYPGFPDAPIQDLLSPG